ncbi:hypothetical protein RB598_009713 [Gaeumannomyces tritici]
MPTPASLPTIVSSAKRLQIFLSSITPRSTLYLDIEGKDLGRRGTLNIITALIHPRKQASLIDVQKLGKAAFTTANGAGATLKSILEDQSVPKYFWDVRTDAVALWAHHQVRLAGVMDVQLLEKAARRRGGSNTDFIGLRNAVKNDLDLPRALLGSWLQNKQHAAALFRARQDIFSLRPLRKKVKRYCVDDVEHLPALAERYVDRLDAQGLERVRVRSAGRVDRACDPSPVGRNPRRRSARGAERSMGHLPRDQLTET